MKVLTPRQGFEVAASLAPSGQRLRRARAPVLLLLLLEGPAEPQLLPSQP